MSCFGQRNVNESKSCHSTQFPLVKGSELLTQARPKSFSHLESWISYRNPRREENWSWVIQWQYPTKSTHGFLLWRFPQGQKPLMVSDVSHALPLSTAITDGSHSLWPGSPSEADRNTASPQLQPMMGMEHKRSLLQTECLCPSPPPSNSYADALPLGGN